MGGYEQNRAGRVKEKNTSRCEPARLADRWQTPSLRRGLGVVVAFPQRRFVASGRVGMASLLVLEIVKAPRPGARINFKLIQILCLPAHKSRGSFSSFLCRRGIARCI